MKQLHSIKFKLIAATLVCVAAVTLFSSLFLYRSMNSIVEQKSSRIQQLYLATMQGQIDKYVSDLVSLVILTANDKKIVSTLAYTSRISSATLDAQSRLNLYLNSCPGEQYVDKFLVFSSGGHIIQASTRNSGNPADVQNLLASPQFLQAQETGFEAPYLVQICPSISSSKTVLSILCPIRHYGIPLGQGFVYLELGLDLFSDLLQPYTHVNNVFLLGPDGEFLTSRPADFSLDFAPEELWNNAQISEDGLWKLRGLALAEGSMTLCTATPTEMLDQENAHLFFILLVVFLTGLFLATVLAALLSAYFTKPIQCLNRRLQKIAANDFSFDPEIESSRDEIGEIGHTVNQMTMSIHHLLEETEEMYNRRQKIEISLLQSQVNPHFLYNTLDSIRWMAVIQKCPGIANMVCSLVNLLKNIAKDTQDRIPLAEEMALLNDYIAIQNVRYMETFSFVNQVPEELSQYRIIKLTLQPLVENAIFHGIEPTGECGTITLSGHEEGEDIVLTVEDNGAGIEPEQLATLLTAEHKRNRSSMNGIGVANVHKRLQLTYGRQYGLSIESIPGQYTRVHVRFPKEV